MLKKDDVVIYTDNSFGGVSFRLLEDNLTSRDILMCIFLENTYPHVKGDRIYLLKKNLCKISNNALIIKKIKSLEQRHKNFIAKRNNKCTA